MRPDAKLRELYEEKLELERRNIAAKAELARLAKGGPRTEEGKRIASMNAVKTALTGRTVLLPSDDADAYRQHLAAYQAEYTPVGLREAELVQSLADTQWRLGRIPGLESAIYAKGRHEFAEQYADHALAERLALIDLDTHLKYEKQLRNLQLQESRLHRRYEKESAELRLLQKERKVADAAGSSSPKAALAAPASEFVFSNEAKPSVESPASIAELSRDSVPEAA